MTDKLSRRDLNELERFITKAQIGQYVENISIKVSKIRALIDAVKNREEALGYIYDNCDSKQEDWAKETAEAAMFKEDEKP